MNNNGKGFVRVLLKGIYEKEIALDLQKFLDKAFFVEQAILARQIAASNYICRIYRQLKKGVKKEKKELGYEEEDIIHRQRAVSESL